MYECRYGREPLDMRLFVLQLLGKLPVILLAAVLGAALVGGPYFLVKVTFGPAKEYEAVSDFYVDYAVKEDGTQHTYINYATWDQLLKDDIFTDRILFYMSGEDAEFVGSASFAEAGENAAGAGTESEGKEAEWAAENVQNTFLEERENAAGITKDELKGALSATILSDLRIITTTVKTNDPELTMKIEKALVRAMLDFGEQQKEIAELQLWQEPAEASLVIADVRTFRACMVGAVAFVFVTVLYLCLYYAMDEGIYVPAAFERRFGIPMLGTVKSEELPFLAGKLLQGKPVLLTADKEVDLEQVRQALAERKIETEGAYRLEELFGEAGSDFDKDSVKEANIDSRKNLDKEVNEGVTKEAKAPLIRKSVELSDKKLLLIVKAGVHNGKRLEKALDICEKCGFDIAAALLWDADEKLLGAYELPEHVFHAWRKVKGDRG